MNFREKVKELCKKRGITQKRLAEILEITDISLNQTLRGKYPQLQTLEKIAYVLNIPISELFEEKNNKETVSCPYCGHELSIKIE